MTLRQEVLTPPEVERSVPVLRSERLTLRAPRGDDAAAIARFAGDLRVSANTARIPHPYAIKDAEQFIAQVNSRDGAVTFAISFGDALVGVCGVYPGRDGPEIGYWVGVPFWGCGYATEAVRALIDHAFGDLGCETLYAGARVSNPASRRVLEKCGFQWTGVQLIRIRALNSAGPADRFRLDRGLWSSLKSWGRVRHLV